MDVYHRIYRKLERLGVTGLTGAATSTAPGFMDLCAEEVEPGVFALAHYFEQNGDLCADPDMTVRVFPEQRLAEALSFQQAIPPIYREVYPVPGKVDLRAKRDLNRFLDMWLGNAIKQGHTFAATASAS